LNSLLVADIGRTRYADAWALQKQLWQMRVDRKIEDVLLLTEHEHVFTLGKSGDDNHVLASAAELRANDTELFHIDRGGDVTYHGPGQIVGYPILDLNQYKPDIHLYLSNIEEVIILSLVDFGIHAGREDGMTGVWVDGEKIAAIGVKVSKWITMHGFALNVNTDLTRFERIIPCGIFHKGVTSLQKNLGHSIPLEEVYPSLVKSFCHVFGCEYKQISKEELQNIVERTISDESIVSVGSALQ
jgi:lipoyl(octanoyl) transferase